MLLLLFIFIIVAPLVIGQIIWAVHVHFWHFLKYDHACTNARRRWEVASSNWSAAYADWGNAMRRKDTAAARLHYNEELAFYEQEQAHLAEELRNIKAMQAAMDDMLVWPWKWPERWNADYYTEANRAATN